MTFTSAEREADEAVAQRPVVAKVGAILASSLILLATAGPAAAECVQFDRWPSFREAALVADRVVIGKVIESYREDSGGLTFEFRFQVDEVLRGKSPEVVEFHTAVRSGVPLTICPDNSFLRVHAGDVLAFAFDATLPQYPDPVLAVAFVNRDPDETDRFQMPGVERLSRATIRNLVGMPPTDTEAPTSGMSNATNLLIMLAAAVAGACLAFGRMGALPTHDIRRR